MDGNFFKWRKLKSKAKYEECSSSCTNFGFLIYSFNPNRTLVGLAIIKLLSLLSIFERNYCIKCGNVKKNLISICMMSKVLEKTKGYRPWSLACFSFLFSSIAHILLLIHDMVSNFGGE